MAWSAKYQIQSEAFDDAQWRLDIEQEDYAGSVTVFKGGAVPFLLKYTNNDEVIVRSIAASELTITFISDTFELEDIIDSDDKKYRVSLYRNDVLQWRGFLSTDDCSEEYTSGNRTFELIANDGLGLLKFEDNDFDYAKFQLVEIIGNCLEDTNTELDLLILCRVFEESMEATEPRNPFDQSKVHTRLFLTSDNGPQNKYEVLEAIMGCFNCTLYQSQGQWRIVRFPDLVWGQHTTGRLYTIPGLLSTVVDVDQNFKRFEDFLPVNGSHVLSFLKPSVTSTITHDYIIPEVPRNPDLQRGDRLPSEDIVSPETLAYSVEGWEFKSVNTVTMVFSDTTGGFRQEVFNVGGGIDDNRLFLRRDAPFTTLSDKQFFRSTDDCLVDEGDKFSISGATKLDGDISGSGSGSAVKIRVYSTATAGYEWNGGNSTWVAFNDATGPIGSYAVTINFVNADDLTVWRSFSVETTSTPIPGRLVIWLQNWAIDAARYAYYKNIDIGVTIMDRADGNELTGERSTSTQNIISRKKTEMEVKLGNSPKRVVASALWRNTSDTTLTTFWGRFGQTFDQHLIDLNSVDLHRLNNRVFKRLEGDYRGCTSTAQNEGLVGPGNIFNFNDATATVYWLPVSLEINPTADEFRAMLVEVTDDDKGEIVDSTTFKFLFNERSQG